MKKFIFIARRSTILLTLHLVMVSCLFAETTATTKKGPQLEQKIMISTDDSVHIEIKNATLHDTLKAITKKSRINFEVPESLLNDTINFRSTHRDWPETLKKMLKKYNIAYGWEKKGLEKVFIFEHGTGKILQLIPPKVPESADNQSGNPSDILSGTTSEFEEMDKQTTQEFFNSPAFLSMPPLPDDEEKIIEIKNAGQDPDSREKMPDMEKEEDLLKGIPPELIPELPPGQDLSPQQSNQ